MNKDEVKYQNWHKVGGQRYSGRWSIGTLTMMVIAGSDYKDMRGLDIKINKTKETDEDELDERQFTIHLSEEQVHQVHEDIEATFFDLMLCPYKKDAPPTWQRGRDGILYTHYAEKCPHCKQKAQERKEKWDAYLKWRAERDEEIGR